MRVEIFSIKFSDQNLDNTKEKVWHKLKIFLLKYFYEEVSQQYRQILASSHDIETDEVAIKAGIQKELFDYKTFLEKKILQLEIDVM